MIAATCPVCAGPDVFHLGLCPHCAAPGDDDDALVFVRRAANGPDGEAGRERLAALLADVAGTADGRAALRGDRALLRVPAGLADQTVSELGRAGVPARAVPVRRAWAAMPAHFFLLLVLIAGVGTLAGQTMALFRYASAPFAALLLLLAHRGMRTPLLAPAADAYLGAQAEAALRLAFANVGGRARDLLADLVRLARPLAAALGRDCDPAAVAPVLDELIVAACGTATEVNRLETAARLIADRAAAAPASVGAAADIGAAAGVRPAAGAVEPDLALGEVDPDAGAAEVEAHAAPAGGASTAAVTAPETRLRATADRCLALAETGTRRLLDATRAVTEIGTRTAVDAATGSRLVELTRELQVAASAHEHTLRELDALLR